jgi:hypothetical protein
VRVKGKGSGGKELPLPQLRLEGGLLAFYLLLTEPERGNASCRKTKQGFARRLLSWLRNGRKLRYIHRNPVKRGLVLEPDQCAWRQWCRFRGDCGTKLGRPPNGFCSARRNSSIPTNRIFSSNALS